MGCCLRRGGQIYGWARLAVGQAGGRWGACVAGGAHASTRTRARRMAPCAGNKYFILVKLVKSGKRSQRRSFGWGLFSLGSLTQIATAALLASDHLVRSAGVRVLWRTCISGAQVKQGYEGPSCCWDIGRRSR
jgi:hypothetical protein